MADANGAAENEGAAATEEAGATEAAGQSGAEASSSSGQSGAADGANGDDGAAATENGEAESTPDWRAQAANGDKNLEKLVKRFASPHGLARALADTKAQLSKAQVQSVALPEDATDEQKAEWRKAREIPDAPDGYDVALKGIDWSDDDKAVIGEFSKSAHDLNLNKSQVKGVLQWYANEAQARLQQNALNADRMHRETEKALRAEYGADYDRNVTILKEFGQATLGAESWEGLIDTQMADGTKLGDNPAFIRLIVDSAMDRADGLPFVSGGGAGGMSDADLIARHKELTAKASGRGKDANEAKAKLRDADYERSIQAAYERQNRRDEAKGRAA